MIKNNKFMAHKYAHIFLMMIMVWMLTGCLDFGEDTTEPTSEELAQYRERMFLNADLEIESLGFKYLGSGIDDAMWFKFRTNLKSIEALFDSTHVKVSDFSEGFTLFADDSMAWWDVSNKTFIGGQVYLPNYKTMNIGIHEDSDGLTVYIFWFET